MISIIIPVYNAEPYLCRCFNSILTAGCPDFEVLMIDDGSTDGSRSLCEAYQRQDPRFRLLTQANQGPSAARNQGLAAARGDYIAFIDADDMVPANHLSEALALMDIWNADLIMGGYQVPEQNKAYLPNLVGARLYCYSEIDRIKRFFVAYTATQDNLEFRTCPNLLSPWGKIFHRNLLQGLSFREELTLDEDTLFNLDVLDRAQRVLIVPEVYYLWRQTPGSLSRKAAGPAMIRKQSLSMQAYWDYVQRHPELDLTGELSIRGLWAYARCLHACVPGPSAMRLIRMLMDSYRSFVIQAPVQEYYLPKTLLLYHTLARHKSVFATWIVCVLQAWKRIIKAKLAEKSEAMG